MNRLILPCTGESEIISAFSDCAVQNHCGPFCSAPLDVIFFSYPPFPVVAAAAAAVVAEFMRTGPTKTNFVLFHFSKERDEEAK